MKSHQLIVPVAAACAAYQLLLREPILRWGATPAEAASRLPGDEMLGGAYTYDWIENLLRPWSVT